jgi:hypothetical protein
MDGDFVRPFPAKGLVWSKPPRFLSSSKDSEPSARLPSVAQMRGDLHECGDVGAVYVWIEGDTAYAVMQSH